eukprot:2822983-Rhodomonas_salina.4
MCGRASRRCRPSSSAASSDPSHPAPPSVVHALTPRHEASAAGPALALQLRGQKRRLGQAQVEALRACKLHGLAAGAK